VSKNIRLAVMDMWKPFSKSTLKAEHAPQVLRCSPPGTVSRARCSWPDMAAAVMTDA
jgi:hypothetical protein